MRFLRRRRGVVVVVRSVLDVPQHSVLLLLVTVQHAWLGRFVAAHVTRVPDHFVLRPFVQLQIDLRRPDVLALVAIELSSRVFCKFVSLQAAKLGGLIRADVTVVRFPAVIRGLANSLVLGLLVSCQAALLSRNVTALVASVLRVFFVLRWLDAAGLTSGVVHLVEAVPEKQNINKRTFSRLSLCFEALLTHLA